MRKIKATFRAFILFLLVTPLTGQWPVEAKWSLTLLQVSLPAPKAPQLSEDGKAMNFGLPIMAVIKDPNPPETLRRIPPPARMRDLPPDAATATFSITYVPDGGTDPWGERCYTFPQAAKNAFNAAAQIWGNILQSSVPVTISACWADLGSPLILGYSGGGPAHRDFSGAPRANTWYTASLANALSEFDLNSSAFDMHITYNQNFDWYYGTDGNPSSTQVDLVTVVLHEICHGLNFSGSMRYSAGIGSWGYGTGYPNIYDVFMKDGSGNLLTSYVNGSTALGDALTSNNIWFHGANAKAANGGQRVKIYAPDDWQSGSSYSHLDYATFNDTPNQLMVFAISAGESIHDPGPITKGLLKDLGWPTEPEDDDDQPGVSLPFMTPLLLEENTTSSCPAILNGNFDIGYARWTEYSSNAYNIIGQWGASRSGTWSAWLGGLANETAYIEQTVLVGSACPYLVFFHWIASEDVCGNDIGYVKINGENKLTFQLCSSNATGGWVKKSINLSNYANQSVELQFRATTNASLNSNWFIEDVSLKASAGVSSVAVPLPTKEDSTTQMKMDKVPQKPQ
jgi:hypothetical protein